MSRTGIGFVWKPKGEKPVTKSMTLRLSSEMKAKLYRRALASGLTASEEARKILEAALT